KRPPFSEETKQVRCALRRTYPLVINNQSEATARTIDSENPSEPSQTVGRCGRATVEDAMAAISAASAALEAWRDRPAHQRAELLFRTASILRRRRFELAAWAV